jgi:hypothetical protein
MGTKSRLATLVATLAFATAVALAPTPAFAAAASTEQETATAVTQQITSTDKTADATSGKAQDAVTPTIPSTGSTDAGATTPPTGDAGSSDASGSTADDESTDKGSTSSTGTATDKGDEQASTSDKTTDEEATSSGKQASTTEKAATSQSTSTQAGDESLADGTYYYVIQTSNGGRGTVDVASGSKASGGNVQLYSSNGTDAQKWKIVVVNGIATIQNVGSGKYLDVSGGKAENGRNVWQYDGNGSNAQKWFVYWVDKDSMLARFVSYLDSMFSLDIAAGGKTDGTNIQVYRSNDTGSQKFYLWATGDTLAKSDTGTSTSGSMDAGYKVITNGKTNKVLDVSGGSTADGAIAQTYDSNGTIAQGWRLTSEGGCYRVQNILTGKSLTVASGDVVPGSSLTMQASKTGDADQLFYLTIIDGKMQLVSKSLRLALTVSGSSLTTGRVDGSDGSLWSLSDYTPAVDDGYYTIGSALGGKQVLDVSGGSFSGGGNVQTYSSNGTSAQRWLIEKGTDGFYTIRNVGSGLYLSHGENGNVIQSQGVSRWSLSFIFGSGFVLVSGDKVADVAGGVCDNGTNVQMYVRNDSKAQGWVLNGVNIIDSGYYVVRSAVSDSTSMVLDVSAGDRGNGANVQTWQANGSSAQIWYVERTSDGTYTLRSGRSGRYLDVEGGSTANGANVWQYNYNGTDAQLWVASLGKNGIVFTNKNSGKVLDVSNGSSSNGANVQVYTANDSRAQCWHMATSAAPGLDDALDLFAYYMASYANDNSHGYDQVYRWGEYGDYDCSSLVITCLRKAGFDTGNASYTGDMRSNLTRRGWTWITNFDSSDLRTGDILLSEWSHTAAMISPTQLAQASGNEWGGATGGTPGDQTGREINIKAYYDFPWDGILRFNA